MAAAPGMIEPWTLLLDDLCLYVGEEKHSALKPRVIYQVVYREVDDNPQYPTIRYRYRVAFDPENPTGTSADTTISFSGTRNMKKLTLQDLGILRLSLDTFIRDHARYRGMETAGERAEAGTAGTVGAAPRRDPDTGTSVA